jgi:hypothetical protein
MKDGYFCQEKNNWRGVKNGKKNGVSVKNNLSNLLNTYEGK